EGIHRILRQATGGTSERDMHYQIFCGIFLKNSSVKGMGSIASTVLYSDIHRITRNVFLRMQQKLMNVRVRCVAAD
ncbi:hypothetical protein, partial [Parabacteroides sp.]|uniref:hypothetical protein n=1 Tax=Parabacteroides sp. TaxID=1869337 RepID=UPI0038B3B89D